MSSLQLTALGLYPMDVSLLTVGGVGAPDPGVPSFTAQAYALEVTASSLSSDIYVNDWAGNPLSGNGAHTIEFWLKGPDANVGFFATGAQNTSLEILFNHTFGNEIRVQHWNNDHNYAHGGVVGSWTHLAVTFDGTDELCYINGSVVDPTDGLGIGPLNVTKGNIRLLSTLAGALSKLQMFQFRLWSVVRTPAQIAEYMHLNAGGGEPGLECAIQMNEGTGAPADQTGHTSMTITIGDTANGPNWAAITDPRTAP